MPLKFAANIATMFTEISSFAARYEAAKMAGFQAVESLFLHQYRLEELTVARERSGVKHVLMSSWPGDLSAGDLGIAALPGREKDFRNHFEQDVQYCKALECQRMHILSGKIPPHDEGQRSKLLVDMENTLVENLKFAVDRVKKEGIVLVIEPINGVYTIPNYFLAGFEQAMKIIDRVGSDHVKLQFDVFHAQVLCGNLTKLIKEYVPKAGHVQISQVPGRNEPSFKGELDYDYIFELIESTDYDGWIGTEYQPSTEKTEDSLAWMQRWV